VRLIPIISLLAVAACSTPPTASTKLIVLGWDGMPDWVVDSLLAEGRLPGLARLARDGAHARHVTPGYPSITAQGWAALWTGAYGDVTGATGNTVPVLPRSEHTLLESESGFAAPRADPIWMAALRADRRVVVLSTSGFGAAEDYHEEMRAAGIPLDRLVSYNQFGASVAERGVLDETALHPARGWQSIGSDEGDALEFSLAVGESAFHVLVFGDPSNPREGLNTAAVCADEKDLNGRCELITAAEAGTDLEPWSEAFVARREGLVGRVYFRLFDLAPDGSRMLFYQRAVSGIPNPSPIEEEFLDGAGAVSEQPQVDAYLAGDFGPPVWEDGDGTAERRLLEVARLEAELSKRAIWEALDLYDPDVLLHYTAITDQIGHALIGALDPRSPRFELHLADELWPVYVEVLQLQDQILPELLDRVDSSTIVTVLSDHGMGGAGTYFSPNAVLEEAGLLARRPDGSIDLASTSILGSWGGGFFLNVNSTDWKGGIVPPEGIESVLERATRALLSYTAANSDEQIVTGVFRPVEVVGLGIGGPAGGDLYLDFAYGYHPSMGLGRAVRSIPSPIGMGRHGYHPLRAEMQTIWLLAGPGIAAGQELPAVRQIDIAPTLAALIGVQIPRDAEGLVVGQLDRPRPETRR
jgi:predicted AlkP superfamily pyrophosphatase or phosphodiesterase